MQVDVDCQPPRSGIERAFDLCSRWTSRILHALCVAIAYLCHSLKHGWWLILKAESRQKLEVQVRQCHQDHRCELYHPGAWRIFDPDKVLVREKLVHSLFGVSLS